MNDEDQYCPIYQVSCAQCEAAPVVGIRSPGGTIICTHLCGPHFFGDRNMTDPENWNNAQEATE